MYINSLHTVENLLQCTCLRAGNQITCKNIAYTNWSVPFSYFKASESSWNI